MSDLVCKHGEIIALDTRRKILQMISHCYKSDNKGVLEYVSVTLQIVCMSVHMEEVQQ